jgi:hypothetical protein
MSKSTTTSGTGKTVGSDFEESIHGSDTDCKICHLWIASKTYSLHLAGHRMIDAAKIVANAQGHRAHGVMSEAHFHFKDQPCKKECVA